MNSLIHATVRFTQHLEAILPVLGGTTPGQASLDAVLPSHLALVRAMLPGDIELAFLIGEGYPTVAPVLFVTVPGEGTEPAPFLWDLDMPGRERLAFALHQLFQPPGPYRKAYATEDGRLVTEDRHAAGVAGWRLRYGCFNSDQLRKGLAARTGQDVFDILQSRRVLVAGLGSVGGFFAECLVRTGVGSVALLDGESVAPENLSRTIYEVDDVGRAKAHAALRRLVHINPHVRSELHTRPIQAFDKGELADIVQSVDLVVAATDDLEAQRILNRMAFGLDKAAVFAGLYAGADGGEVVMAAPRLGTPCYLCATRARHTLEVAPTPDYGSGRLPGEIALQADIHHVTTAAVKLAVGLLMPEDHPGKLRRLVSTAAAEGHTYLTMGMTPEYWFYPRVFQETAGQYAFQSVWLTPQRQSDCPVCGDEAHRCGPLDIALQGPSLRGLREVLDATV